MIPLAAVESAVAGLAPEPERRAQAVQAWLQSPLMICAAPPAAIARRCERGRPLDIWNTAAIVKLYREIGAAPKAKIAHRTMQELILGEPMPIQAANGDFIPAQKGDRLIYIPGERVEYPYMVQFPNGDELVVNDPDGAKT